MLLSGDISKTVVVTHVEKLLKPTIAAHMTGGPMSCLEFISEDTFAMGDVTGAVYTAEVKKI